MVPVEIPRHREILIRRAGVGNIPDHGIDIGDILSRQPGRVEIAYDGSRVDEVAVVEMVVVIVRVAKVGPGVARLVRGRGDNATPSTFSRSVFFTYAWNFVGYASHSLS